MAQLHMPKPAGLFFVSKAILLEPFFRYLFKRRVAESIPVVLDAQPPDCAFEESKSPGAVNSVQQLVLLPGIGTALAETPHDIPLVNVESVRQSEITVGVIEDCSGNFDLISPAVMQIFFVQFIFLPRRTSLHRGA